MIAVPDPNVTIGRDAIPLPVEVVVRGYITGVTNTSLWTRYVQGERDAYGIPLPDGLRKNDPLPARSSRRRPKPTAARTTSMLTRDDILNRGLVAPALWEQIEAAALALFAYGQEVAQRAGLILVDTKYEFGLVNGQLTLSTSFTRPIQAASGRWILTGRAASPSISTRSTCGCWFADQGYRGDGEAPDHAVDLVVRVAARYIAAYERLTGREFVPGERPARQRRNLRSIEGCLRMQVKGAKPELRGMESANSLESARIARTRNAACSAFTRRGATWRG